MDGRNAGIEISSKCESADPYFREATGPGPTNEGSELEEEESEDSVSDLLNPLGVEKEKFKKFLKDWKKENL